MQELLVHLTAHPKKHLIFDFDQTLCKLLVDWRHWHENIAKLFQSYEPSFKEDEATHIHVQENYFISKYGPEVKKEIDNICYDAEKNYSQGFVPDRELIAVLPSLKEKYSLSLWSSNDRRTIDSVFRELGLTEYFDPTISVNDVKLIKPDADGFTRLIHPNFNYSLSDYLMIGDSRSDENAAKNSGIDFFNVITKEYIKAN